MSDKPRETKGLPKRWSARRKSKVVLRLLRGEGIGERLRVTVVAPPPTPDPKVSAKATRRRFTAAYKLSIVEQAERCETPGEVYFRRDLVS